MENDFGCAADTLVNLEVIDNPGEIITAGPDQVFCSTPVMLEGDWTWERLHLAEESREITLTVTDALTPEVFSYCPDTPGDGTLMSISFTSGMLEIGLVT